MRNASRRIRNVHDLGATLRGRRIELQLSQADLAAAAGVSRQWLSEMEAGKSSAEIGLALRVLDVLDLDLVPEPRRPEGPKAATGVDLDEVLADHRRP